MAALILGSSASCLQAGSVTQLKITYDILGFNSTGTIHAGTTYAGAFTASYLSGAPLPSSYGSSFTTFCLDMGFVLFTPGYYSPGDFPNTNEQNGNPTWLKDGIYKAAYIYNQNIGTYKAATGTTKTEVGAGIQLAIWNVLYDKDYSLSTGNVAFSTPGSSTASGRAYSDALSYLGDAQAHESSILANPITSTYWDTVTSNGGPLNASQALIGPPLPEAAELALLACAVGGLALGYRRIRRAELGAVPAA